ncbi:glycosyltransferase family 52 [Acinetobacter gyllenbergii]|uniref:glycosyltransferase family 52 n=1 Tax=Acinetobacter gyllenbergii TaxID=134534 RepID=UPI00241F5C87|nr:glycosyltransferase family 52 [Acinetobacter gyllenbergii]
MLMRNKNLIICLTPLQMLIMETILRNEKNRGEDYTFICICYNYNEKYNTYFNRLSDNVEASFIYKVTSVSKVGRLFDLLSFNRNIIDKIMGNFNNIYFASIDNPFVQLILSRVKSNNFISFDDGTANLWENSVYNRPIERSNIQKVLSRLVGIKFNEELIKSKISKHYTIFYNNRYLKERSEFVSLFNLDIKKFSHEKKVKIFLGQPLSDYNFELFSKQNVEKIIKKLKIDSYFPHPREIEALPSLEIIRTNKIFEDYIVEVLGKGYSVEVYTFFSSAALTVSGLENVQIFSVVNKQIFNYFSDLFNVFDENGIRFIEVEF